jgi:phospholipase C
MILNIVKKEMTTRGATALILAGLMVTTGLPVSAATPADSLTTTTPIKHLVVLFMENRSYDHYFGTYPIAMNLAGEPVFTAAPNTPPSNNYIATPSLLTQNPNFLNVTGNGTGAVNPFRFAPAQAWTTSQNHAYMPEQNAYNKGAMNLFPSQVGTSGPPPNTPVQATTKGITMGYYDGNTATAWWNYAQHFSMSDNFYDTNFGPSTVGALNVISGQTNGVTQRTNGTSGLVDDGNGSFSVIGDPDPFADVCSTTTGTTVRMAGQNIGDLLNTINAPWGWFQGGFDLTQTNPNGTTGCNRSSTSPIINNNANIVKDYVPHHAPFQYYASTANPTHKRPISPLMIGKTADTVANHNYDIKDFYTAILTNNFPAVSYLKAPAIQNDHASNSDTLDAQTFIVQVINFLQSRPEWATTAVIITYDDSDGWYDHVQGPIVNTSTTNQDSLTGTNQCGTGITLPGPLSGATPVQGRCAFGPRLPFQLISPWSRVNYISHAVTDQSSVVRFIEDNWLGGLRIGQGSLDASAGTINDMFDFTGTIRAPKLVLDATTGTVLQ